MSDNKIGGGSGEARRLSFAEPSDDRERSNETVGNDARDVNGKSFDRERLIAAVHKIRAHYRSVAPVGMSNGPWNRWNAATLFNVEDFDNVGALFVIDYADRLPPIKLPYRG